MKRIAIPIERSKLSEYLGKCKHFEIFEIGKDTIKQDSIKVPYFMIKTELPGWLASVGVTDVIMYKIDKLVLKRFQKHKINLFIGVHSKVPENLIRDYLEGKLWSDGEIISEILDKND
jgi:hypothetical protein